MASRNDERLSWAGIAALEGRPAEALTGFLDALRAYAQLGLPFEEAAAAVDMAVLLRNVERESPAAAAALASARETLEQLGAAPFLGRLTAAVRSDGTAAIARQRTVQSAPVRTTTR